jgi:hypothetical protein
VGDTTSTFTRKPYNSGHSKVITVGGLPALSKESEWIMKRVEVGGEDALLAVSSDDVSEEELRDIEITVAVEADSE